MIGLRWIKPAVVIDVAFTEWTAGGNLRHASFVGLRDDKPARAVRREE
jgi:bifunctional non-homologous end joining protein LigD